MTAIIKDNLDKIIEVCKLMHVQSLYLFGSGTKESKFTVSSDLDFLYQFQKNKDGMLLSDYDYFDLMFKLQEITGKNIDLVAEEKISNPFFSQRVNAEKIELYEFRNT